MYKIKNRLIKSIAASVLFLAVSGTASGQTAEEFYVPLPEAEAFDFFSDITGDATLPVITRTDIVIRELGTEIIFDPYDAVGTPGYETDYSPANEGNWATGAFGVGTERWGDGDCANGFNPNLGSCSGAQDVFTVGEVVVFDNSEVFARDHFRASETINLTRSLWPSSLGTFLAGAFELFPASQYGTSYIVPIGENTPGEDTMFESTAVTIMASEDNTLVDFDPNNGGSVLSITLDRGESVEYGNGALANGVDLVINQGATISSTLPVQVNVLTGDIGSDYEARFYTLFPNALLSNSYYEAVGTTVAADAVVVFLYNPNNSAITVDIFDNLDPDANPTQQVVAANSSVKIQVPTATGNGLTGLRFTSQGGEVFSAFTAVDDGDRTKDWGHVTTPERLMGDTIRVGFAPGNDPNSGSPLNASPVWLIADVPGSNSSVDIQICVDADGDGGPSTDLFTGREYDYLVTVQPLDSTRLYQQGTNQTNNSEDQTGMLAFACNVNNSPAFASPTEVIIAAAWGQDPQFTASGDSGIDVGTTIRTGSNNRLFIGDFIFEDIDGDGVQDIGEVGLAGVSVTIVTTNVLIDLDPVMAGIQNTFTTVTDADGLYLFDKLTSGEDYTVTVTPPAGFAQTYDPDATLDNTTTISLFSSTLLQDFGYASYSIGDRIFLDANASDSYDALEGIDGVTVRLTPTSGQDIGNGVNQPITTITASDGLYLFEGLPPGDYTVDVLSGVPSGYAASFDDDGGLDETSDLSLGLGVDNLDQDFGYVVGTVGDRIFQDANGNDSYDAGEGIDSVIVELTPPAGVDIGNGNGVAITTTTGIGNDGFYEFSDLPPGNYSIAVVSGVPANYAPSFDNDGGLDEVSAFTLTAGQVDLDQDFGYDISSIGDRIFLDANGNNSYDALEGIDGVTVQLTPTSGQDIGNGVNQPITTVTASDGLYQFDGLPPGDYTVDVISGVPSNYAPSFDDDGGLDETSNVTLANAGDDDFDQDFGYATSTVGDRIFRDLNGNGSYQGGEGIDGVLVQLTPPIGVDIGNGVNQPITTTTASDGLYLFEGLPPGNYTVDVISGIPAGLAQTVDPDGINDETSSFSLAAGTADLDQDFGYVGSDLGIVKTSSANGQTVSPGDTITYTIVVTNEGLITNNNVTLTDILPAGVSYNANSTDVTYPAGGGVPQTGTYTSGDIADPDFSFDAGGGSNNVYDGTVITRNLLIDGTTNPAIPANAVIDGDITFVTSGVPIGGSWTNEIRITIDKAPILFATEFDADLGIGGGTFAYTNVTNFTDADGVLVYGTYAINWEDKYNDGGDDQTVEEFEISFDWSAISGGTTEVLTAQNLPPPNIINDSFGLDGGVILDPGESMTVSYTVTVDDPLAAGITELLNVAQSASDESPTPVEDSVIDPVDTSASVAGRVWLDEDLDGINDIEEAGITSVTVQLIDENSAVVASLATDANGNYLFTDVVPGDYTVNVFDPTLPLNLTNTAGPGGIDPKPVSVDTGDNVRNVDFGYIPDSPDQGAIGDRVWSDANGNGIQDPGEPGIEGVVLSLLDTNGVAVLDGGVAITATTNKNGDYLLTGVPHGGDYIVTISTSDAALTGYTPTTGPQSEGGYVGHPVSLSPALSVVTDVDFGFDSVTENTNSLSDTVWFDENGDGVKDVSEPGISGVSIDLYIDANNDNVPDDDNADGFPDVLATAITDENGVVSFAGLPDGSYLMGVTDIASQLFGLDPTTIEAFNELSLPVALSNGASPSDTSFGYNQPGLISGTIYSDTGAGADNANADQDAGEAGFEGLTVSLFQDADLNGSFETAITSTVTDLNGYYEFSGLPAGAYQVSVDRAGSVLDNGAPGQTEDPEGLLDDLAAVTIAVGASSVENDFGYTGATEVFNIDGTVFLDPDKDGFQDGLVTDPGIVGVTLDLIDRGSVETYNIIGGRVDYNQDGVISAADNGVVNGVSLIAGEFDVVPGGGVDISDDGTVGPYTIVDGLVSGAPNINAPSDGVIASITTDGSGDYQFSGLPAGDYSVAVSDADRRLSGYDITSGLDVLDVTIVAASVSDVDFGYINDEATGSIAGEVFIDENTNGTAQDSETNLTPVDVYLCSSPIVIGTAPCDPTDSEYIATTITDANGEYVFNGLPPGVYEVGVDAADIPAGLTEEVTPPAVSLSEGEDVTDVDVGYEPGAGSGVLAGFVWTDTDNNGQYDPGEAPIAGVTINVYNGDAGGATTSGDLLATAVTQADGSWIITGIDGADAPMDDGSPFLRDGYIISYTEADIPSNLESATPTNLSNGDIEYFAVNLDSDPDRVISNLDFGFRPDISAVLGSISGTIYSDLEATPNGSYNELVDGELAGVSVNLVQGGVVIATVLTDANGFYQFTSLPDGDYSVVVSDIANITKDLNTNELIDDPINIANAPMMPDNETNHNAGYVSDTDLNSIGSKFFFDVNGDGVLNEGEDTNRNGILDIGEDIDMDGFLDPGESGIPGITIQCWLDNDQSEAGNTALTSAVDAQPEPGVDNLIRTEVTDENGDYFCTSLPAGDYIVVVKDSLNYDPNPVTGDAVAATGSTDDGAAKNWAYALTLASDQANYTADFAVAGSNSVEGYVRVEDPLLVEPLLGTDSDTTTLSTELDGTPGDGSGGGLFPGEGTSPDTAAEGVPVQLLVLQGGEYVVFTSTTTDADGFYEFTSLPDGDYVVEVLPDGSDISGFGQTGDPSLSPGVNGDEDLVCDSPTDAICDDRSTDGAIVLNSGNPTESGVNFMYQRDFTTTPVTMSYFKATRNGGSVEFKWETVNEVGNAGFQIYARGEDSWELISSLIASLNVDPYTTNSYHYDVSGVNAQWFSLVAVSTQEEVTPQGPFKLGEEYGAHIVPPEAFDWSGIDSKHSTSEEVNNSVSERLQRAMREDPEAFQ